MSNSQFNISARLVDMTHKNFEGFHAGYRAVHASGRYYAATFTASAEAKTISRALHFQGKPTPTTIRFSNSPSGDPFSALRGVSMAAKFFLPDGTVTDLIGLPIPIFPTRTPEETLEFLEAAQPDPATGLRDMAKIDAFVAVRPWIAQALQLAMSAPAAHSFAQTRFNALHAFRFINESGEECYARYSWEPEAGVAGQTLQALQEMPPAYLFDELETRLRSASVAFSLVLQMATGTDPTNDPNAAWPDERVRVPVGTLFITRVTTPEEIGDVVMLHDPTRVTDGIELSDDPILAARRGIYEMSVAHRTGGWQGRGAALARADAPDCPLSG